MSMLVATTTLLWSNCRTWVVILMMHDDLSANLRCLRVYTHNKFRQAVAFAHCAPLTQWHSAFLKILYTQGST
ncbi:hypothetical protein EDB84DRAFT_1495389 [Lactarius hengduanensis]|nr:hypothetical protein EDB84DRAFT_1497124 [Lactarius hengduanensis]KAH9029991.1 hypothetical protein EDB84DRAFT_1495389 [Lactarius hengduanensis]